MVLEKNIKLIEEVRYIDQYGNLDFGWEAHTNPSGYFTAVKNEDNNMSYHTTLIPIWTAE